MTTESSPERQFESIRSVSARHARLVFKLCGGNKARACRELGISYHTLNAYLKFTPESGKTTEDKILAVIAKAFHDPSR